MTLNNNMILKRCIRPITLSVSAYRIVYQRLQTRLCPGLHVSSRLFTTPLRHLWKPKPERMSSILINIYHFLLGFVWNGAHPIYTYFCFLRKKYIFFLHCYTSLVSIYKLRVAELKLSAQSLLVTAFLLSNVPEKQK